MTSDDSRVADILDAAARIARHLPESRDGLDDEVLEAAFVRWLSVIGEAAAGLSPEFRARKADIPWHQIIGMRHRLIHDYAYVDIDVVWASASADVPELALALEPDARSTS